MAEETDIAAVTTKLYGLLKPLDPVDRRRVVQAVSALLGDGAENIVRKTNNADVPSSPSDEHNLPNKVKIWIQNNNLADNELSQVFHFDGGLVEVIAGDAPGKTSKEKTINAYILTGTASFLQTGDAKFGDKAARDLCKNFGCLNEGNHASYMKDKGNLLVGSKASGWTLTGPGLKAGADLIKGMTGS